MSKKQKKVSTILNYTEHSLMIVSLITGCVSISIFAFLVGISLEISSSAVGLKIYSITARIKKNTLFFNKYAGKLG